MKHTMKKLLSACFALLIFVSVFPQSVWAEEHEHVFSATEVVEPNCSKAGYTIYKCDCEAFYTADETEARHKWGEWANVEGGRERICQVCLAVEKQLLNFAAAPQPEDGNNDNGGKNDNGGDGEDGIMPVGNEETQQLYVAFLNAPSITVDDKLPMELAFGRMPVMFCTDRNTESSVPFEDLSFSENLSIEAWSNEGYRGEKNACGLRGLKEGIGTVSYKKGNTVYSIQLPVVQPTTAFYTSSVPTGATIVSDATAMIGKYTELYLCWTDKAKDVSIYPDVSNPELDFHVLEYNAEKRYMKIGLTVPADSLNFMVKYTGSDDMPYSMPMGLLPGTPPGSSGPANIQSPQGKLLVGFAEFRNDIMELRNSSGISYEADDQSDHWIDFNLGIMIDGGENGLELAGKEFYSRISDVSFSVSSCKNADGSAAPYCSLGEIEKLTIFNDIETWQVRVNAAAQKDFQAVISMKFSYTYNGRTSQHTVKLPFVHSSEKYEDSQIDASSLDTAEKLNQALSSLANLQSWYGDNNNATLPSGDIYINLPAVIYEDVITANVATDMGTQLHIHLKGSSGTTMPGLIVRSGSIRDVEGISFVAGAKNSECGILAEANESMQSVNFDVKGCSISGFPYGIKTTATGYVNNINNCVISNCERALYLNSDSYTVSPGTSFVMNNRFVENKTAIEIQSLPDGRSPYSYSIQENLFLGSQTHDLKVKSPGKFFAYRNFFGDRSSNSKNALLDGGNIISNPRKKSANSSELTIDTSYGTDIINNEAGSLLISGDSFVNSNAVINVVDGDTGENVVASWSFGG